MNGSSEPPAQTTTGWTAWWAAPWQRQSRAPRWLASKPVQLDLGQDCGFRNSKGTGDEPGTNHRAAAANSRPRLPPVRVQAFSDRLHPPAGRWHCPKEALPQLRHADHNAGKTVLTPPPTSLSADLLISLVTRPAGAACRTQAATVSLCTSSSAQQRYIVSMTNSFRVPTPVD